MRSSGQNKFDSDFPLYIFGFPFCLQKGMATEIEVLKIHNSFDSAFICIYTATRKITNRLEQFLFFCDTPLCMREEYKTNKINVSLISTGIVFTTLDNLTSSIV